MELQGSFRKGGRKIDIENLSEIDKKEVAIFAANIADMIANPSDYNLVAESDGSQETVYDEFTVVWLEGTNEYAVICGYEVLFDGYDTEKEAQKVYDFLSNKAHVIAQRQKIGVRLITDDERGAVNAHFSSMGAGHPLSDDMEVLVAETMEQVAQCLGHETSDLDSDEIEALIDVRNVWFDGEETHCYYIITQ